MVSNGEAAGPAAGFGACRTFIAPDAGTGCTVCGHPDASHTDNLAETDLDGRTTYGPYSACAECVEEDRAQSAHEFTPAAGLAVTAPVEAYRRAQQDCERIAERLPYRQGFVSGAEWAQREMAARVLPVLRQVDEALPWDWQPQVHAHLALAELMEMLRSLEGTGGGQ